MRAITAFLIIGLCLTACGNADLAGLASVPDRCAIGTTWLAGGQSNMARDSIWLPTPGVVGALRDDPTFRRFHKYDAYPSVPGIVAIEIQAATTKKVKMVATASGGTQIAYWMRDGVYYDLNIVPHLDTKIKGVFWWQGESDAGGCDPDLPRDYHNKLMTLIDQWREDFDNPDLPFFIVELTDYNLPEANCEYETHRERRQIIREAQYAVADDLHNVFIIESLDITYGDGHPSYAYGAIAGRLADAAVDFLCKEES